MSKGIQGITRYSTTHSAVLDRESPTDKVLIEQWPHKGGLKSWCDYNYFDERGGHTKGTPYKIWSLPVDVTDYDWIMNQYRDAVFRKEEYDWAGIRSFITKGKHNPDQTFCSELMSKYAAMRFGWDELKPETIHPGLWGVILQVKGGEVTQQGLI